MNSEELSKLRTRIDGIDAQIIDALVARFEIAEQVGRIKSDDGADPQADVADFAREEQVVRDAIARGAAQASPDAIERIFREIISACLARQRALRISYLGPAGTFSSEAARMRFGGAALLRPSPNLAECMRAAESGETDCALVPFENSIEGGVGATLDELVSTSLVASAETYLRIHQCLLAQPGADLADIKRLYSHPQSFGQCRIWIDSNLGGVSLIPCDSNAAAADKAAADDRHAASIGPAGAARARKLEVLESGIEDNSRNTTRFLVLSRHATRPSGDDKTSVMFAARDRPGALVALLEIISSNGINMTKLESRPMPGSLGQYLFYTDMGGHSSVEPLAGVIAQLRAEAAHFKLIGSYPRAATEQQG